MTAAILPFNWRRERTRDWSDQELAEFYRVIDALTQAGIVVETERGVTDEDEPWLVFVHPDRGEVIAHFARIDSYIVADSGVMREPVRGRSLSDVLDRIVDHYAILARRRRDDNLYMHPAALLTAFVLTALLALDRVEHQGGSAAAEANEDEGPLLPAGLLARSILAPETGADDGPWAKSSLLMTAVTAAIALATLPPGSAQRLEPGAHADLPEYADDLEAHAGKSAERAPESSGASALEPGELADELASGDEKALGVGSGETAAADAAPMVEIGEIDSSATASDEDVAETVAGVGADTPAEVALVATAAVDAELSALEVIATANEPTEGEPIAPEVRAQPMSHAPETVRLGDAVLDFKGLGIVVSALLGQDMLVELRDMLDHYGDAGLIAPFEDSIVSGSRTDDWVLSLVELVFPDPSRATAELGRLIDYVVDQRDTAPMLDPSASGFAKAAAERFGGATDLVLFESDSIAMDAFFFMPGVVFVKSEPEATLSTPDLGEPIDIALEGGGTITVLGVVGLAADAIV